MKNVTITITTTQTTKNQLQEIAQQLGVSLNALFSPYIGQLIRSKGISLQQEEIPNKQFQAIIKQARKDYKAGKTSPRFDDPNDASAWLDKQVL